MSKLFQTLQRLELQTGDLAFDFADDGPNAFHEKGSSEAALASHRRLPGTVQTELVLWSSKGLIDDLATLVRAGYGRSPWGGVEVGGVLFGTIESDGIHVCAFRTLEAEHQHGPAFDLSARDLERLNRLLADARYDDSLKGLVPVGWYHSVSNRECCLTGPDTAVHDKFFPEPWQVALVLKRSSKDPVMLGLFGRQNNGSIAVQPGCVYKVEELRAQESKNPIEPPVISFVLPLRGQTAN